MNSILNLFRKQPTDLSCPPEFIRKRNKAEISTTVTIQQAGTTVLLRVTSARIEIIEVAIQAKGLNSWQIFYANQAQTPLYEFTQDQAGSIGGFVLDWPDVLSITTTTAAPLSIAIRYRV